MLQTETSRMDIPADSKPTTWKLWLVILLFFAALLPLASDFAMRYPDERHYTDGAMLMQKTGDWLTPKEADGTLRFKKPVLTYWIIAASYKLFGISPFSSRLPFLLAGCGIVFLTYRLTLRLFQKQATALLAAVIVLSTPQIVMASMRSMPDVLFCCFMLLSASGFARLIVLEEKSSSAYWAAYGGAALALNTKGFLAFALVGFAFVFCAVRNRARLASLIHWPIIGISFGLGFAWFIYTFAQHGTDAWNVFFSDQVSGKVRGPIWRPFVHVPEYLVVSVVNLVPWSLFGLVAFARQRKAKQMTMARWFLLLWFVFVAVLFGFGKRVSLRYVLPAIPIGAIFFASVLQEARSENPAKWPAILLKLLLGLFVVNGIILCWLNAELHFHLSAMLAAVSFLAAATFLVLAQRKHWLTATEALALALFLVVPLNVVGLTKFLLPEQAEQIVRGLRERQLLERQVVLLENDWALANRIRVLSKGSINPQVIGRLQPGTADRSVYIFSDEAAADFPDEQFRIEAIASTPRPPRAGDLINALKEGKIPELFASNRDPMFKAERR